MATPGFVGGVAEGFEGAVGAAGFSGDANLSAMMDQFVGELDPVVTRDDLHELLLDFLGVSRLGETEAVGEA